ncbi:hypothetical protein BG011_009470 [Mortierella polycephala]|uniref:Actin-like ATPase domain-containing protein n=1 Tax=Mortierella polycephala TaxID=41804 RepID=A0A9P6TWI6_9FUNG|nr:hypothetical protein BG011_009470 [Mortierella polycephala]
MSLQSNTSTPVASYTGQRSASSNNLTPSPLGMGPQRTSNRKMTAGSSPLAASSPLATSPLATSITRPTKIKPKPEMPTTLPPESVCECFICHAASPYSQQPPPEIPANQRQELSRLAPTCPSIHLFCLASRLPMTLPLDTTQKSPLTRAILDYFYSTWIPDVNDSRGPRVQCLNFIPIHPITASCFDRNKHVYLSPHSSRAHDHLAGSRSQNNGSSTDLLQESDNKVQCMVLTFTALGRSYDVPPGNDRMKRPPKGWDVVHRQFDTHSTGSTDVTTGEEYAVFAADAIVPLAMILYKLKKDKKEKKRKSETPVTSGDVGDVVNGGSNGVSTVNVNATGNGASIVNVNATGNGSDNYGNHTNSMNSTSPLPHPVPAFNNNNGKNIDFALPQQRPVNLPSSFPVDINFDKLSRAPLSHPTHPQQLDMAPSTTAIDPSDVIESTSTDPRSPHTAPAPGGVALPPSYNSIADNRSAQAASFAASSSAFTPPPPVQPSQQPFQNIAYQQQYHQHSYPVPGSLPGSSIPQPLPTSPNPINSWPAQPSYSSGLPIHQPSSPASSQHYEHRPYVIPGSMNQTYPIIMAIDWGTTYSSMAYAYQQDGEVHEVSTWPKQSHNYPKVPTCNLYGPDSKEILEWGYPAKLAMSKPPFKHHVLLSKYKLHLDESSGPHTPLPNGLTVVDAIADYLRLFHAHVVQAALKGFGSAFDQHHIQYCLSVPAMWTDHAKAIMRQAALQAGMITPMDPPHRLLLISEPEAAALYCEKKCDQFAIGPGQRFMICDAGGGTVDLIVFEVAVGSHGGRTLREVTRGSGHSCGSVFLDERMEALLRQRFSKWKEHGLTATNWRQLMDTFIHNVKPLFDGIDDQYINMPAVPGRADMNDYEIGLEEGVLTVTAEEMRREVFDPVVDDVLRLIHHQLEQTGFQCNAILLVGGFGCSSYLQTRVRSEFGSKVGLVAVPPRAELAVVRGAVIAGIAPRTVAARVARRWYGVDALMLYEAGYDMQHKQMTDRNGQIRAMDRFSVYVTPGQQIGVDECISKRYVTYQYPKPVNSPLYACSSPTMPRYVDSPQVEKIGDFTIPLPYIPGASPGHKVMFELRMYFGATEIRAEAEVNGVVVSTRCQFTD